MEILCTVIEENREQWKSVEASGEYRMFELPPTYSTPLSPLPHLEKCKIERKLNALQLSTCCDDVVEDSDNYNTSSWKRTNGNEEYQTFEQKTEIKPDCNLVTKNITS